MRKKEGREGERDRQREQGDRESISHSDVI